MIRKGGKACEKLKVAAWEEVKGDDWVGMASAILMQIMSQFTASGHVRRALVCLVFHNRTRVVKDNI